ncbi:MULTISPECIES: pentapeptide repeat-containing protein [Pseudanabaena]|uniref:Pentapeptide repeat protein n=2 Tax=Pseudanabaena TaxID=1152 RepID=L8N330_9CYAN|nr:MULTISPECIES: pentapeptide repeat-containing protein [Pseudanabaena]ELS33484.1 hypothetical protein Pse7429DRAFT_2107 [Pseudanabaena biceps PCC 7429]MDG3494292.1 hypothetical protein [Pseudanabaena catenata USMAC16]
MDNEEFLEQYESGRRDFSGLYLEGIMLGNVSLKKIDLSESVLAAAQISRTSFVGSNLSYG